MGDVESGAWCAPGDELPGTRWRVERWLGEGGMGAVCAAKYAKTGERRAIKVLSPSVAGDPDLGSRLVLEATVLKGLRSPHFVRVYGVGRLADGRPFFVMDLLEGETVRAALDRGGAFGPPRACGIVHQALGALDAVHAAGLVHRDVKPANLFLRASDGVCVLLDFGLVKVLAGRGRFGAALFPTGEGVALGTARYLPPEAGGPRAPDARADVYAAGVVLAELLAGGLPLSDLGDGDFLRHVEGEGFPIPDSIPAALRPVVERATASDPGDRYGSAAEFAARLGFACLKSGIDLASARPADERGRRPRPRRAPIAPALALSAAGAAAGVAATLATTAPRRPQTVVMRAEPRDEPPPARAGALPPEPEPAASAAPVASAPAAPALPQPPGPADLARRRDRLEARLRAGRGTLDEQHADINTLRGICLTLDDDACVERAQAFLDRLAGSR